MTLFLRRWRWRHLFFAWAGYWAGLALVTLWRPIMTARHLAGLPEGSGSITAEVGNAGIAIRMIEDGVAVWSGSASFLTLGLWIAGPPILLWIAWAAGRARPEAAPTISPELGRRETPAKRRPALGEGGISFADKLRERPRAENAEIPRDRKAR